MLLRKVYKMPLPVKKHYRKIMAAFKTKKSISERKGRYVFLEFNYFFFNSVQLNMVYFLTNDLYFYDEF